MTVHLNWNGRRTLSSSLTRYRDTLSDTMKDLTTVKVATVLIFLLATSVSTATTEKWFCTMTRVKTRYVRFPTLTEWLILSCCAHKPDTQRPWEIYLCVAEFSSSKKCFIRSDIDSLMLTMTVCPLFFCKKERLRSKIIFHRSELTWLAFMSSFPFPATRTSTTRAYKEKMSGYAPGFTVVSSTSRFANVLFANFWSRFEYVLG